MNGGLIGAPGFAALMTLAASVARSAQAPIHQIPGYLVPIFIIFGGAVAFTMLWFVGLVTGRLLGLRPPWWRMLIEAYLGGSLGAALASSVGAQDLNSVSAPLVYFASVLIVSMLFMVVFELIVLSLSPASGQPRSVSIPNPIRAVQRRYARGKRYLQIMGIVTRHGLGQYLSGRRRSPDAAGDTNTRRLWARVSQSLAEAGGAFVKLGQVLSTRADLLPPEAIAELSHLQDNAPPAPPTAVAALLTQELGAPPAEVFATFEEKPVAAASIAQAHLAELSTGERVIVKVQRPGIREPVERDLDILTRIAHLMESRAAWARTFGVMDLAQGFAASLREELDFRVEARNIAAVAASLDEPRRASHANSGSVENVEDAEVRIPRVFREQSTDRVLVIELLDGVNVREADPLIEQLGLSRPALARTLLRSLLRQILREGTFHADPHPGNVMVLRTGQLALIDFGSVGRLDPLQQAAIK